MRVVVALLVGLMLAVPSPASSAAAPRLGIEIASPEHKVLEGPNEDGDLELSVKVMVKNTLEMDESVQIVVQALDRDDYEVLEVVLAGPIRAGKARPLTQSALLQKEVYRTIVAWRVEEVTITALPADAPESKASAPR
jgi:hypothetical protein